MFSFSGGKTEIESFIQPVRTLLKRKPQEMFLPWYFLKTRFMSSVTLSEECEGTCLPYFLDVIGPYVVRRVWRIS